MALKQMFQHSRAGWAGAIGFLLAFYPIAAFAQNITLDGTLGPTGTLIGPNYTIPQAVGTTVGSNLFHSFGRFNLTAIETATFQSAATIRSVFGRVTGGLPSAINGRIRTQSGDVNLFLFNPNGFVFGRNARLEVSGSFIASTATSVVFADGTQFSATAPQASTLLTVNVPIGLQFGTNPGRILVQGNGRGLRRSDAPPIDTNEALRVQSDRTLALVGGSVDIEGGTLKTAGGRLELGSVAGAGFVGLVPVRNGFMLNYDRVPTLGDIRLTQAASVDASGLSGGDIQLRASQITLRDGSQVEATTLGNAAGGSLTITASKLVKLDGSTADNPGDTRRFPTALSSDNRGSGQVASTIAITTPQLSVNQGARISASNTGVGEGRGGDILVNASDSVELSGTGISQGGVRSSGISVQNRSAGIAGTLTINTGRLVIREGAEASASTFGDGDGGTLTVNATKRVELVGTSADGLRRSGLVAGVGNPAEILAIAASVPLAAMGKGGDLRINTGELQVSNGAVITVSSRSPASTAQGAGTLRVQARSILLDNQGAIAAETASGQGGDISLNVQDLLLLRRGSSISTTAGTAQAGGDGGNITINSKFIVAVLSENSDITANAFTGSGGRVNITAQGIFGLKFQPKLTPFSDITASSQFGINGTVTLNLLNVDPSRGLVALPVTLSDPSQQISQDCKPGSKTSASSFVSTGRGGIPLSPDEPLEGRAVVTKWVSLPEEAREMGRRGDGEARTNQSKIGSADSPKAQNPKSKIFPPIVEAQGWIVGADGIVELVADVPSANPAVFWTNPVPCQVFQGN